MTLHWTRHRHHQSADSGHRVSAAWNGQDWQFSAWAPPEEPELSYWQWADRHHDRTHYPRGSEVPQRVQHLGTYLSAERARAACQAHHDAQQAAPTAAPAPDPAPEQPPEDLPELPARPAPAPRTNRNPYHGKRRDKRISQAAVRANIELQRP
jgi:hypothetical protein